MDIAWAIKRWPNAKMIFTSPSHQFPLGGTLSLSRRMALLDWATAKNMWIFEDNYNSEFRYTGQPIQALQGLDQQQRVIYARHVRRVRKACHERQRTIVEAIQRALPQVILAEPSDSGIHIVCWLSAEIEESYIIAQCRKAGLGAQPLSRYCQTKPVKPAILLGFAAHSPAEIVAGIERLAQTMNPPLATTDSITDK